MKKEISDYLNGKKQEVFNSYVNDIKTLNGQIWYKKYISSKLICTGEEYVSGEKKQVILDGNKTPKLEDTIKIKDSNGEYIDFVIKKINRKEDETELEENAYRLKSELDDNIYGGESRHYIEEPLELTDDDLNEIIDNYKDIIAFKNGYALKTISENIRTIKNIVLIMFVTFCVGVAIPLLSMCSKLQ